jgi:hypothetical protein
MKAMPRIPATLAAACAATLALIVPAVPAAAANHKQVDQANLMPALDPGFAPWSCVKTGQGTTCKGGYTETYEGVGTGLLCAGEEVVVAGTIREQATRWFDAEGRATRSSTRVDAPADELSLPSAGDGRVVTNVSHFSRHRQYATPGDPGTSVLTEVGLIYSIRGSDGSVLLQDAGTVTFAAGGDFEVVDRMSGRHDNYEDPSSLERVVCGALT